MRVQPKTFYADLFSKGPPLKPGPAPARIAAPASQSRALVPVNDALPVGQSLPPLDPPLASGLRDLIGDVDAHNLSPRQMADLSQNLYAAGVLSFEEYSLLAFQPELHPDFAATIGALTGETAAPDRPRDFVDIWRERAGFQRRHNAGRTDIIEKTEHIAAVLSRIESPTNIVV